ncbi:hypothetical protein KAZ66_05450 [Candidatus Woesebacteria bacterium]|nr:hypothetical protein [Candidatus Woesebacteria bacterium]
MHKKLILLLALFFILSALNVFLVKKIHAETKRETHITIILQEFENLSMGDEFEETVEIQMDPSVKDKRVAILKAFFRRHDSPLYEHAEYVVKVSDENGLDYRLIPAISMQESGACKVIPINSYNCWGWGIYGNTVTRFSSYPEALDTVARGLKKYYIDKGLRTPEEIMRKYNPSSNGSWAFGVNTFIDVLE